MSSIPLKPWLLDVLPSNLRPSDDGDFLVCICSSVSKDMGSPIVHASLILSIPGYYAGAGDVFSALLLGHLERPLRRLSADETSLSRAVSMAVTKTHAIMQLTYEYNRSLPEEERPETDDEKDSADPVRRIRRARGRELRIIQGRDIISAFNQDARRMTVWQSFWDENS
jgi:pyridoxine kinase